MRRTISLYLDAGNVSLPPSAFVLPLTLTLTPQLKYSLS